MRRMTEMTLSKQFTATPSEHDGNSYHEDYGLLMSLALDDLLDQDQAAALQAHLSTCGACHQQWQIWQSIDQQFQMAPVALPPLDFASAVEAQIERRERRRHTQVGVMLAILTFVLWALGFAGIGLLLGFLVYNQVGWFGETLHWLAYAWTALSIIGSSLWAVILGLGDNPSAIGAVVCYIVLAIIALGAWTQILRRSTRPLDMQSA
jgi:hypothetical protein